MNKPEVDEAILIADKHLAGQSIERRKALARGSRWEG